MIAIARWVLPVPVPPTSTALRWLTRNAPVASSRTRPSLTGVVAKSKPAISLANGSLAMVNWYLIERAVRRDDDPPDHRLIRLTLVDLGLEQVTDDALRRVLPLHRIGDHLVISMAHAGKLQRPHHIQDLVAFHDASSGCRSGRSRRRARGQA